MSFFKKNYLIAFALVFLLGIAFLKFRETPPEKSEQTLRIALGVDIQSMDIVDCNDVATHQIISLLFEGLMRKDENNVPQNALAKKIEISEDGKTYIFHLKETTWSDGTPLTAHDFVYSWKRSMNPKSKFVARTPQHFYDIKNGKKALLGEVSIDEVGVYATDNKTLVVELELPSTYFLRLMTLGDLFPIPRHIVEKDPNWGHRDRIVCNGPFRSKEWKRNNKLIFEKNPHYWDETHVYLDKISVDIVPDHHTTLLLFEKGELDWVGSPFIRPSYDSSANILDREEEDILSYWYWINTAKYPLNNKKLRKALSFAINRQSIVENVFHSAGIPRMSVLAPAISVSETPYFLDNNRSLAKRLFDEALLEMGLTRETFPEITLGYVADVETHSRIAQAIQDQWRKVLDLKNVRLKQTEWKVYLDDLHRGNYDIGFLGWSTSLADPYFVLEVFRNKDGVNNMGNWEHPDFGKLLDRSKLARGKEERNALLKQAEDLILEEMPVIPMCSLKKRYAKNPRLKGEIVTPLQLIDFKSAYFDKEIDP